MAKQKESRYSKKMVDWLNANGWKAWKNSGSMYQEAGRPDVMAIRSVVLGGHRTSLFMAIEAKVKPEDGPTPLQQKWLDEAAAHGAVAFCAHSVSEMVKVLKQMGLA